MGEGGRQHTNYKREAGGGAEAVEYYQHHSQDIALVILDMIMPKMNGRECYRALRTINPQVKTILVTGYDHNHAAQEILDEGVLGFVQKPYDLNSFSKVVAQAIASEANPNCVPSR